MAASAHEAVDKLFRDGPLPHFTDVEEQDQDLFL
jgi:hypothetical protein